MSEAAGSYGTRPHGKALDFKVTGKTIGDVVADMGEVYVVMVDDRHADTEPHLFSSKDAALDFARRRADGWLVEQPEPPEGWLYYAYHPTEGDAIWVVRKTLDPH